MNLLIIAGFLGSGKTTLLQAIARNFAENTDKKIAIIENEVGKVGIDDQYLKEQGLKVKEIYSGCICCSLRLDLINTLLELERQYEPDIVIVEPSGVAGPKQVIQALDGYGGEIEQKQVVVLIDAVRFQKIQNLSIPIIEDGIDIADFVVVNKIDQVGRDELDELKSRLVDIRPDVKILPVSAVEGTNVSSVLKEIADAHKKPVIKKPAQASCESAQSLDAPKAVVHAEQMELVFDSPVCQESVKAAVSSLIHDLAEGVTKAGCSLIGHIKAIVKSERGYLLVSSTCPKKQPHTKGMLSKQISSAQITVNAIVYGVEKSILEGLVSQRLETFLASMPISRESE